MAINATLRTKGVIAMLILIGYLALIAVFIGEERKGLVDIVQKIEATQTDLATLEPVLDALGRSLAENQHILNTQDGMPWRPVAFGDHGRRLNMLDAALDHASASMADATREIAGFRQAAAAVKAFPTTQHLAQVRDRQQELLVRLQRVRADLQKQSALMAQRYRDKQQFISTFAIAANIVGAVASVAVILVFFTRLANDIKRLGGRAAAIVAGYDGEPLTNARRDEVGGLIDAVNRMQGDLRRWERQVELTRQQRFHQEKMAAVGSLASAIGHEVSNPIAAISGVAQLLVDETRDDERPACRRVNEFGTQILKQSERIAHIMRQMAALTAPRSPDPEILDLNALIRSTCGFIRYDKRFRGIEIETELDHDLPAITAVADHVTQVLMNLLINAADATDHIDDPQMRRVRVTSQQVGDDVRVDVIDNGRGMAPAVLARAFDESFTTKPLGKGRGIGLFVSKSLVEQGGGRIELRSAPDEGTTATLHLPLRGRDDSRERADEPLAA